MKIFHEVICLVVDKSVSVFLIVIVILGLIVAIFKSKAGLILKGILKILAAGLIIYIFDILIGKAINFVVPLNILNAASLGILGIPGIVLIFFMKYIIYP